MAGQSPTPRAATKHDPWPEEMHRAALFLGLSGIFYWLSFSLQGTAFWINGLGVVFPDLILGWIAVLLGVAAWPSLWIGLRELKRDHPGESHPVLAWRAFLLTLALVLAGVVVLPLRYPSFVFTEAWLLVLYVSALPFLAWTFVPTLALHGVIFGRASNYLGPRAKHVADIGTVILFAVAAATTAVILQNPTSSIFLRTWAVGRGLMPAASCLGYIFIATGMSMREADADQRTPKAVRAPKAVPPPVPKASVRPVLARAVVAASTPGRGWAFAKTPRRSVTLDYVVSHR